MVKLSRRGPRKSSRKNVRKSKRSNSRKYRKSLKGGLYNDNPGKFLRKSGFLSGNKTLYELEHSQDNNNDIYTLDFTKSDVGKFLGMFMTANKFSKVLIDGLNTSDVNDKQNITDIINKLFENGIDGVKTRKLKITESKDADTVVDITLFDADNLEIMKIDVKGAQRKMGEFFKTLKDDIIPSA